MRKFSQFKPIRKINEQDEIVQYDQQQAKPILVPNQIKKGPVSFFSKLLESREMAQVYHWTVKGDMGSHAAHLALQEYYEGIITFIDEMVEVYQGQYGLLEGYDIINTTDSKTKDKIEYFTEIADFIKRERFNAISESDTHIHNIVDEALALVYKTLYKLKFNK